MNEPVAKSDGKEHLAVLFPGEEVNMGGGINVRVTPLPLENLKDIVDSFHRVMEVYNEEEDITSIISKAFKEVMDLLPFCIDRPMKEIPSGAAPDILRAFIKQNFPEDAMGKWISLVKEVTEELKKRVPSLPKTETTDQGKKNLGSK